MQESHTVPITATVLPAPRDHHPAQCEAQQETEDAHHREAAIVTYPAVPPLVADHVATIDSDVESDQETQSRGAAENAAEADPEALFAATHLLHVSEAP